MYRIVSLVPSLTESLCDFGLQDRIVGCTNFCVSPKSLRASALAVGGTKDPDIQKIISLRPTHIITNHEENTEKILSALKSEKALSSTHIIETFPKNLEDTISMIQDFGQIFACEEYAQKWLEKVLPLQEKCSTIKKEILRSAKTLTYCYFIWRNPWMVAGDKTYISAMLNLIGLENAVVTKDELLLRYPVVKPGDIMFVNTNICFFSSEPFPFKNRHILEFKEIFSMSDMSCFKVDGQNLSWYGTRTLKCLSQIIAMSNNFITD